MSELVEARKKHVIPMIPLRDVVMFPHTVVPLFVGREASIKAIDLAQDAYDKYIFLVAQKDPDLESPQLEDLYSIGTVSRVLQLLRLPDGTVKVLFEGLYRATWEAIDEDMLGEDGSRSSLVSVNPLAEVDIDTPVAAATMRVVFSALDEYSQLNKKLSPEAISAIKSQTEAGKVADLIAPHIKGKFAKRQELLETLDTVERLEKVGGMLFGEVTIASLEKQVKSRVKAQMEENQKEYYLNEQLKAIHKEMGREDDPSLELNDLEEQMKTMDMPEQARERGLREIKKLRYVSVSSAEYSVIRNYIDWILDLPWNKLKETSINIAKAKKILDADHFGLEKAKERIIEYLAVQSLTNKLKGPILCLVGPPGVGKTSLAKSIAKATDRDFVRLSLGGVRDEAEIRGHRRTYVGAMPGKIIQSLRRSKSNNPLFCLDEIDKLSSDHRGDPASALLEVLDAEQNDSFGDHYLDLDYDLSKIFFVCTANSLHSIPAPLRDRLEIIQLSSYLETEKLHIAEGFLLPKQQEMHGLKPLNIQLSENALLEIIRFYTKEAGVRNLEREIATVCRKVAKSLVESKSKHKRVSVSCRNLSHFLGEKKYQHGKAEEHAQVGICAGLAYTEFGGELLLVETALMPGTGQIKITGKLGSVMVESAQTALSYLRSRASIFGLRSDFHKDIDIHIHVPDGATPKDGPSAGITLACSIASALLNIPTKPDLAMTGEITLRGRVLPIGGLREKLLAAQRGKMKTVLIPQDNVKDLKDVPQEVLRGLDVIPVESADTVLLLALAEEGISWGDYSVDSLTESLKPNTALLSELSSPQ